MIKSRHPATSQRRVQSNGVRASILILVAAALTAPWFQPTFAGSISIVDLSIFAAALYSLVWVTAGEHQKHIQRALPLIIGALFFVVIGAITAMLPAISNNQPFDAERFLSTTAQYAFVFILFPIAALILRSPTDVDCYVKAVAIGYFLPMIVTLGAIILPIIPTSLITFEDRASAFYGNPNAFATVIALTLPVYFSLSLNLRVRWCAFGLIGVGISFVCLVLTASFSGAFVVFAVTIACLVFMLARSRKKLWRFLVLICVFSLSFGGGFLLLFFSSDSLSRSANRLMEAIGKRVTESSAAGAGSSVDIRLRLINEALDRIYANNSILGIGLGQAQLYSDLNSQVHMLFLLLMEEGGVFLLVAFVVIISILWKNALGMYRRSPDIALPIIIQVFSISASSLFHPHIYLRYFWIPLLPAFTAWHASPRRGKSDSPEPNRGNNRQNPAEEGHNVLGRSHSYLQIECNMKHANQEFSVSSFMVRWWKLIASIIVIFILGGLVTIQVLPELYFSESVILIGKTPSGPVENPVVLEERLKREYRVGDTSSGPISPPYIWKVVAEKGTIHVVTFGRTAKEAQEYLEQVIAKLMKEHEEVYLKEKTIAERRLDQLQAEISSVSTELGVGLSELKRDTLTTGGDAAERLQQWNLINFLSSLRRERHDLEVGLSPLRSQATTILLPPTLTIEPARPRRFLILSLSIIIGTGVSAIATIALELRRQRRFDVPLD